ncbi:hypothetical protein OAM69_02335 [bacterium]|nr:hypothetical protein [bacterium]
MLQSAMQNAGLCIHFANTTKLVDADQWLSTLNCAGEFGVGMEFTDPRTGRFHANVFRFYPTPQNYNGTFGYLAEHNGLVLSIPAEILWWERHFEEGSNSQYRQSATLVREGELRAITFDSIIKKVHVIDFVDS